MPIDARLLEIVHLKPNETESIVLGTLTRIHYGNAYNIWKESGLHHYPTVLRTLKKLNEKGLVQKKEKSGARGETVFSSTLQGQLVSYVFTHNEKEIMDVIDKESRLFRDLRDLSSYEYLTTRTIKDFILKSQKGAPICFDEVVRESVSEYVRNYLDDWILGGANSSFELIIEMSRIKWIKTEIKKCLNTLNSDIWEMVRRLEDSKERLA